MSAFPILQILKRLPNYEASIRTLLQGINNTIEIENLLILEEIFLEVLISAMFLDDVWKF